MRNIGITKFLIIIFISNILESFIAPYLITFHVTVPITFLIFSYAIFKSNQRLNPLFAFLCGLYVDLISSSPFGLNAGLFTIMCYAINSYANNVSETSLRFEGVFFGPTESNTNSHDSGDVLGPWVQIQFEGVDLSFPCAPSHPHEFPAKRTGPVVDKPWDYFFNQTSMSS